MTEELIPVVIGDSHGIYMAQAFGHFVTADRSATIWPVSSVGHDAPSADFVLATPESGFYSAVPQGEGYTLSISPRHRDCIAANRDRWSRCFLLLEGNFHNLHFMLSGARPFDFSDPLMANKFSSGRQIIPRRVVERFFEGNRQLLFNKMALVKSALPGHEVIFIAPPPPICSEEHIRKFPEYFDFNVNQLNDPWVRLKIYRTYLQMLTGCCSDLGIQIIPPPGACVDADGFLAEPYWNHCTHASADYYKVIMSEHFQD